jgi:hypothetical protein
VILHPHLHLLPSPALKQQFIDEITALSATQDPPFSLDYWRLNMSARRPA